MPRTTIALELWNFLALALDAIAIAAQAIVGKELGAGDADEADGHEPAHAGIGFVAGAVFGAASSCSARSCRTSSRTIPPWSRSPRSCSCMSALMQPLNGLVFVLDGILIGAGDLRYMAWAMVVAALVLVAGGALVAAVRPRHRLAVGRDLAFMFARLVTLGVRFRSGRWAVTGAVLPT